MKRVLSSLFILVHTTIFAQITLTFPINRAIFQRNASNIGIIPITGTFQTQVDKIDARLLPLNGGVPVEWTTISVNPSFGVFTGDISAQAGWYKLEIRALIGTKIVDSSSIEKVGIGEVLIISGQSNAQGYENSGNPPALDDRVNCVSNYYSLGQISEPPFPVISQITENVKIAPFGSGSWCWGKLGDLLAAKLNVPILFINSALEGMSIEDFKRSADGESINNYYSGIPTIPGYPYENLKKSLHYFANMFGVRSILWHQGETDTDKKTSTEQYREQLSYIIAKSREDTGKDINWMISRASRMRSVIYPPVINAQNEVIRTIKNTFEGPETDQITNRPDNIHFYGESLIELAQAWNSKLDSNFFSKTKPTLASPPLSFDLTCNSGNRQSPLQLSMPDNFKQYYWTNGVRDIANRASLETSSGFYRGRAIDFFGNVYYTPLVNYSSFVLGNPPNIRAEGVVNFCEGGSVQLSAIEDNISWNTGTNAKSIIVQQKGVYNVSQSDYLGCTFKSNSISVDVRPLPAAVNISQTGTFTLEASASDIANVSYEWYKDNSLSSNLTNILKAKNIGIYTTRVSTVYELDKGETLQCFSPISNPYKFDIDPSLQGLGIYPNPATQPILNIETQEDLKDATVDIYNLNGMRLKSYSIPSFENKNTLNLSNIQRSGTLIINVRAAGFNVSKRIFIE